MWTQPKLGTRHMYWEKEGGRSGIDHMTHRVPAGLQKYTFWSHIPNTFEETEQVLFLVSFPLFPSSHVVLK